MPLSKVREQVRMTRLPAHERTRLSARCRVVDLREGGEAPQILRRALRGDARRRESGAAADGFGDRFDERGIEESASRQRLLGTGRRDPFCSDRRGSCAGGNIRLWTDGHALFRRGEHAEGAGRSVSVWDACASRRRPAEVVLAQKPLIAHLQGWTCMRFAKLRRAAEGL